MLLLLQLLASVFLAAVGADETDIYFSVSPADHKAVEGQPVRLRCEAEPRDAVRYAWKLDGRKLAASPRRHIDGPDGDLLISRLNRVLDSGSFVCEATHRPSGMSITSSPAKIDIQWISESSVHLQQPKLPAHIRPGMKIELRCQVDGSGELKYQWFRNTKSLGRTQQSGGRLETKRNLLLINEASPEDSGVYRCLARNAAGASTSAHSLALAVPNNLTATVRVVPRNAIVRRGDKASFNCAFDNASKVKWYFEDSGDTDGTPIETDDESEWRITESNDLVIVSAQDKHRGFYSCHGIAADSRAPPQIYSAELQIAYLKNLTEESFEPRLEDQLALVGEGQELQVSCLAPGGLPLPKVYWRDPQGRLISDSGPVRVQDDTLIIARARASRDQGNYSCVAENIAGTSAMPLRVVVTWPPELREPAPRSLNLVEDDPASFSCVYTAMSAPYSLVSWYKDGERLMEQSPRYRLIEQPGNTTLQIKNIQLSDRGNYVCEVATKGFPPVRSPPALLTIIEKLKFSPQPVDRRLELNSTAKVSCKAQGSTPPSIKWYKNGSDRFPQHLQESNGTLHFSGVLEDDKGNYTCIASNSQGKIEHTIRVDVVIAPKFIVEPENLTAVEGSSAMLHCSADGHPKPAIHWDKDSQMNSLQDERFVKMPNDSLYIKEVYLSDEGKYGCTAGNSGGLKRQEVYLNVRAGDLQQAYRPDNDLEASDGSMMTKTVLVTLGAAAAYMLLVIGLMLYCRCRRRRRKQRFLQEQTDAEKTAEHGQAPQEEDLQEVANEPRKRKENSNRESRKSDGGTDTAHSQNSTQSKKSRCSYDKLAVNRSQLQQLKPLGRGEFGEVFSSKYRPSGADQADSRVVLVKSLNNSKDESVLQEFKRQLDFLHKLDHENVAKLIGLCRDEEPDYMTIEYTDWGDLKQFLLASKEPTSGASSSKPRAPQLSLPQILSLASQAALALQYVSERRLVHKDVAARNCLISSDMRLKLSFVCMCKEPHQQEYSLHQNQVIPLRWMPREAVFEDEFSTKSDVYSYAVLVWEMFNQGELPFRKLSDESVLNQLRSQSLTWNAHKSTPEALRQLQAKCWSYDPRERPTFDSLAEELRQISTE